MKLVRTTSCLLAWLLLGLGPSALWAQAVVAPEPGKPDAAAKTTPQAAGEAVDFHRQVLPLLRKYCQGCHNAEDREGGLSLDSYQDLLAGGENGAVLAPGDSGRSRLYLVLVGKAEPAMPPEGSDPPSKQELELLRRWIDQGARGPQGKAPPPVILAVPKVPVKVRPRDSILAVAWSPDGKLLALGRYRRVELVDPGTQEPVRTLTGLQGGANALAFSPDGTRLAAAGGEPGLEGQVLLWDTKQWKAAATLRGHRDSIYAVAFSPDGKLLATASYDHRVLIWDLASGSVRHTLKGHNAPVYDLAWSPRGPFLATASGDRTVKLWDAVAGKRLETFGQPLKEQLTVAFSPDGRQVVAAGADNRLRLWHLGPKAAEGTNRLRYSRFAHQRTIIRVVWSPRGNLLASSAEGGEVKLWDARTLRELRLLEPQPDWAPAVAFSPQGGRLAVGRLDGTWAIYDTATGRRVPPPAPQLQAVHPWAYQNGQVVKLRLQGKHLRGITAGAVSFPGAKVEVLPEAQDRSNEAWLKVHVPADVPPGKYTLSVKTAGGQSNKLEVYVDTLAQREEKEPNNSPQAAQPLALESGIWGTVARPGDVDYYRIQVRPGQSVVMVLEGAQLGSKLNGVLALFDSKMRLLASSNDFDQEADPVLFYRFAQGGTYLVRVTDLQAGGSKDHRYRLSLGSFPLVTGAAPLVGQAGKELTVRLVGFNLPESAAVQVKLPAKPGKVSVPVDRRRFRVRKTPQVVAVDWPVVLEKEPNEQLSQAVALPIPGGASGQLDYREGKPDADLYRLELKAGQQVVIETLAARYGSPADTRIEVLDAQGRTVPRLLLQAVRDSYITFRPIDSDQNQARVANWEEMELNQYMYFGGEVVRLYRLPQGPDSGFLFYTTAGKRRCYFDTSPKAHALDEPCFIVEPHPLGTRLVPNGLPVFTVYYENDDDAMRYHGRDSVLHFTAPKDGTYYVRVEDARGLGGPRFTYHLAVRPPRPDFTVTFSTRNPQVPRGSGRQLVFTVRRRDGFDGPVRITFRGLPPGVHVTQPLEIQAGHERSWAVLWAEENAPDPKNHPPVEIFAEARVQGRTVRKAVGQLGRIQLKGKDKVLVKLEPAVITIQPGTTVTAKLKIVRNGFKQRVTFDVNNLPHGVYVDNIGLNGVLIPPGATERTIFLTARPWVPQGERPFHALAKVAGNPCSAPVVIRVVAPSATAATEQTAPQAAASAADK